MKNEGPSQSGRLSGKSPSHIHWGLLKDTKAVGNKLFQAEARITLKAVRLKLQLADRR